MRACLEELLDNGCSAAIIETRTSRQDATDRGVILDLLRERLAAINFSYRWGTKAEPLLWIADAIGGAVREHLIGEQVGWYDKVAAATGLEVRYI